MIRRSILVAGILLVVTTAVSVGSFRLYYADFFYLRDIYREATEKDRIRLLRIARNLNYHDQRNTSTSMMLSEALTRVGEPEIAGRMMSVQVDLNPDDLGILRAYGETLAALGRTDEADHIFRKLLQALREETVHPSAEDEP